MQGNVFTSIALARNIQAPALVLRELVKPALQELQVVSGFRNLTPQHKESACEPNSREKTGM
jgi:hypothetical protein